MTEDLVTAHFSRRAFYRSQTATRRGIDNTPPASAWPSIEAIAVNVLEPLREAKGPIYVSSGYRCPELNAAVGGAPDSQHLRAEAADLEPMNPSVSMGDLLRWIYWHLPFDQLIWEFDGAWVHVSYTTRTLRRSMLVNKRTERGRVWFGLTPAELADL